MKLSTLTAVMEIKTKQVSNSSLIAFRILFGLLLLFSNIRFILKGWINDFYIVPQYHFTYYGCEWIKPFSAFGMYSVFYLLVLLSLFITLGLFYRFSITLFFLTFTYIELIDKTYYLNHYYAVSLITFIMIFLPVNKRFALDSYLKKTSTKTVDNNLINIVKLQVGLLYFFAGVAKINSDWLLAAQPMRIWLNAEMNIPLIGNLLQKKWVAYFMSWVGAIYDLSIAFLLSVKKIRKLAFLSVVIFHTLTWMLFNIGVFPWVMIILATLFFEPDWFEPVLKKFENKENKTENIIISRNVNKLSLALIVVYFLIQIILPIRHYFYKGNFFWTEQGFRFAWHVMIIEKTGMIEFNIKDLKTNKSFIVLPKEYLTNLQVKMMSTQPDMIIQFSHYLEKVYKEKGYEDLEIKAINSYVALNGRPSKIYINPEKNLLDFNENSDVNQFIMPF